MCSSRFVFSSIHLDSALVHAPVVRFVVVHIAHFAVSLSIATPDSVCACVCVCLDMLSSNADICGKCIGVYRSDGALV